MPRGIYKICDHSPFAGDLGVEAPEQMIIMGERKGKNESDITDNRDDYIILYRLLKKELLIF